MLGLRISRKHLTVVKLNLEVDYIKRWVCLDLEIRDGDLITKLYATLLLCINQSMMYWLILGMILHIRMIGPKIHFMLGAFETFEFVFFAHLMYIILGYTNELSECLQRRE
jgi:hypothetical protein